jgi:CheY-like chemotaxis protein
MHSHPKRAGLMDKILLVDDDDSILTSTSRLLKHLGHEVICASNGLEGMALFDGSDHVSIVITDVRMPIMSGNDLARKVRNSSKSETPIVAVTGSDYVEEIERELFDAVLIKPFRLETLLDVMKSFAEGH